MTNYYNYVELSDYNEMLLVRDNYERFLKTTKEGNIYASYFLVSRLDGYFETFKHCIKTVERLAERTGTTANRIIELNPGMIKTINSYFTTMQYCKREIEKQEIQGLANR